MQELHLNQKLIRFFLVGCVNTLVGLLVMLASYYVLILGYWMSSALNYLVSSVCSYVLNRKYTFGCTQKNWKLPFRFAVNIIICYFLAYSVAVPLTAFFLQNADPAFTEMAAMLAGMLIFSGLNFIGQSLFVFPDGTHQRRTLPGWITSTLADLHQLS